MPDDVQPDEANLTKRERQKLRRQQKLEAQRRQVAQARRKRTLSLVVIGLLVAGLIGTLVVGFLRDRAERARAVAAAAEKLEELGCTEQVPVPSRGASHLGGTPDELAASPPELIYPDRPSPSGPHLAQLALTGVYDKVIDERLLIHNLEHGYVVFYYAEDAPADQVADLESFAQEQIDGPFQKVIVAPWQAEFAEEGNFATVAWDVRQFCREFDRDVAIAFLDANHGLSGDAPERTAPANTDPGQQGVLDPDAVEGPLLFPPLAEATEFEDAMDERPEGDVDEGPPPGEEPPPED